MPKVTHGAAKKHIKLYRVYQSMCRRCYSPKCDMYSAYGGRGIQVCDEWRSNPLKFVDWAIANGYAAGLSIDRRNNNGNYHPDNCWFTDSKTQSRNQRKNRLITFKGETKCMSEWAEITGIPAANIQVRLDRCGWDVVSALTEPPKKRNQLYAYKGEKMTINEWAKRAGVNHSTILHRFKNGLDVTAQATPLGQRRNFGLSK